MKRGMVPQFFFPYTDFSMTKSWSLQPHVRVVLKKHFKKNKKYITKRNQYKTNTKRKQKQKQNKRKEKQKRHRNEAFDFDSKCDQISNRMVDRAFDQLFNWTFDRTFNRTSIESAFKRLIKIWIKHLIKHSIKSSIDFQSTFHRRSIKHLIEYVFGRLRKFSLCWIACLDAIVMQVFNQLRT